MNPRERSKMERSCPERSQWLNSAGLSVGASPGPPLSRRPARGVPSCNGQHKSGQRRLRRLSAPPPPAVIAAMIPTHLFAPQSKTHEVHLEYLRDTHGLQLTSPPLPLVPQTATQQLFQLARSFPTHEMIREVQSCRPRFKTLLSKSYPSSA